MSQRTRFCVLFTGTEEGDPSKTRLLFNDSSRDDINQIWKQIYNEDVPAGAELIINENCVYRLDDDDDITAFLAQAEDQYRILPTKPLQVWLGDSKQFFKQKKSSMPIENSSPSNQSHFENNANSNQNESRNGKSMEEAAPKRLTTTPISNTNRGDWDQRSSPRNQQKCSTPSHQQSTDSVDSPSYNVDPAALTTANSLMMLCNYNRYRGQSTQNHEISNAPTSTSNSSPRAHDYKTVGGAIDSITGASFLGNPIHGSPAQKVIRHDPAEEAQNAYANPYLAYTKHLANALIRPGLPEMNKERDGHNASDKDLNPLQQKPIPNLPSPYAFINNMQDHRAMQSNRSASYILQTIFNNHLRGNMPKPNHPDPNEQPRFNGPSFVDENSSRALLNQQQNPLKPQNATPQSHPFQTQRSSIFSNLGIYNNKNFLNYMYPNVSALQNCTNMDEGVEEYTKKTQKRRKRITDDSKTSDSTKRMRSSISQSNIEYHYQRALEYSKMAEEEQKLQNSAHRSHWKHLLFVAKISPKFMEQFKHAKYDEWSSEARDIYAICQPDKYMWSFLTLSKQGDLLCGRMIRRIEELLSTSPEEKPEWCPDDERLRRAQTRAQERLNQLQRILFSRSATQEAKNNEKQNASLDKMTLEEKNMLVNAYQQQRQHEMLDPKILMQAARMRHPIQQGLSPMPQEPPRPPIPAVVTSSSHGVSRASSLTSSPVSMASPIEDNISAGCAESPPQDERHSDNTLAIAEDKETSESPDVAEDLEARDLSPLPFVTSETTALSSPPKWTATKIEQVADV